MTQIYSTNRQIYETRRGPTYCLIGYISMKTIIRKNIVAAKTTYFVPKHTHRWTVPCPYCGLKVTSETQEWKPQEKYIPYRTVAWRKDSPRSKNKLVKRILNKEVNDRLSTDIGVKKIKIKCPECSKEYETAQNTYFKLWIIHEDIFENKTN